MNWSMSEIICLSIPAVIFITAAMVGLTHLLISRLGEGWPIVIMIATLAIVGGLLVFV